MVQLKALFALAVSVSVATCNPISKRDAALVLADLTSVGNALTTLTASVNAYTGGLFPALTISTQATDLDNAIKKATTDANASAAFTAAESSSITSAIVSLTPQTQATLIALVNKEPLFAASLLNPIVLSQLNTLSADSNSLSLALQAKAVAADIPTLQDNQNTAAASFAFAIAAFS